MSQLNEMKKLLAIMESATQTDREWVESTFYVYDDSDRELEVEMQKDKSRYVFRFDDQGNMIELFARYDTGATDAGVAKLNRLLRKK